MKIRILILMGLIILLSSCGGSKKTTQTNKTGNDMRPDKEGKLSDAIPDIEDLPNPEEEKTPKFESDVDRYIYQYKAVAKEEMGTYGIPASITLAQGILESKAGKGKLTRKSNNHFGIKCHEWDGDVVYHDDDLRQECFRKYKNPNYSFRDHSLFLKNRPRYGKLFELRIDDYKGWARGLKRAGYATDPAYPRKLIAIIERNELYKYDGEVLETLDSSEGIKRERKEIAQQKTENTGLNKHKTTKEEVYVVQKGDTLYSIAQQFGLSVEDLKKQNKLGDNTISIGQELEVKDL